MSRFRSPQHMHVLPFHSNAPPLHPPSPCISQFNWSNSNRRRPLDRVSSWRRLLNPQQSVQVGTIAKGYGRLDIFYYGWGFFLFVTLTLSSFMWTAPQLTVTLVGSNLDTNEPKDSLDQKAVMSGRGHGTFWPDWFVNVVTLVPGLGLKLLLGPILQFTYRLPMWSQIIVTTVYIALYGIARIINPLFRKTPSQI